MAGVDFFYCIQRNTLDRKQRTLKIEAWNETFAKKIIINEFCTYFVSTHIPVDLTLKTHSMAQTIVATQVHEENPEWTCFEQSASLEVKSFFGLENAVEKLAVKHYAASIEKGKEIIELYIEQLKEDGITFVPQFKVEGKRGDDEEMPQEVCASLSVEDATPNRETNTCQGEEVRKKESCEIGATCGSPGLQDGSGSLCVSRTSSLSESRRESLEYQQQNHSKTESLSPSSHTTNHSFHTGNQQQQSLNRENSVKNQVMSKAKNKICFIYNVINENIQREAV
jgi:hypothetical protein